MKKLFLFVAICVVSASAFAQSFQHGIGLGMYVDDMEQVDVNVGSSVTYNPRVNFAETEKMSISVGVPLSLGYAAGYNSTYYDYENDNYFESVYSFMLDIPVMVNLNLWGGSSKLSKQRVGGFIGAGYGYHYVSTEKYLVYDETVGTYVKETGGGSTGVSANGGVRIAVGRRRAKNIEIRLSYYRGMNRNKIDVYGLGALFNF